MVLAMYFWGVSPFRSPESGGAVTMGLATSGAGLLAADLSYRKYHSRPNTACGHKEHSKEGTHIRALTIESSCFFLAIPAR